MVEQIKYVDHNWVKMVNFLLGQQSGCTSFPCFLCIWESRTMYQHYVKKNEPLGTELNSGNKNVIANPLHRRSKIIFAPLHIKLGLMNSLSKHSIGKAIISSTYIIHLQVLVQKNRKWEFLMVQTLENL